MGKTARGVRTGDGPFKGSYQSKVSKVGRRQAAGQKCPVKKR